MVADNCSRLLRPESIESAKQRSKGEAIVSYQKKVKKFLAKDKMVDKSKRLSAFMLFCQEMEEKVSVLPFSVLWFKGIKYHVAVKKHSYEGTICQQTLMFFFSQLSYIPCKCYKLASISYAGRFYC